MKKGLTKLMLSGLLQSGGAIAISYATTWVVGVGIIVVLWGHNIEKH